MALYSSTLARSGEPTCRNCEAACCRDMVMELTRKEAAWMIDAGNDLSETPPEKFGIRRPAFRHKFYNMAGRCALLDENSMCTAHEDPGRPDVCDRLKEGSERCLDIRDERLPENLPPRRGPVQLPMPVIYVPSA